MSRLFLPVLAPSLLAGCVVTETRTIVIAVPKATTSVEVYAVFEGISVRAGDEVQRATDREALATAKTYLGQFAREHPLFLFGDTLPPEVFTHELKGDWAGKDALGPTRYGPLRYYRDGARARPLCADRRMTFRDRAVVEKKLNPLLSELMADFTRTPDTLRDHLRSLEDVLGDRERRRLVDVLGLGPFVEPLRALLKVAAQFDDAAVKAIHAAATRGGDAFRWLRFEPDGIRVVLPASPVLARTIAEADDTRRAVTELRGFVSPAAVAPVADGLAVVFGTATTPMTLRYTTPLGHRPQLENAILGAAGDPGPRLLDGRAATAAELVRRFVADPTRE